MGSVVLILLDGELQLFLEVCVDVCDVGCCVSCGG